MISCEATNQTWLQGLGWQWGKPAREVEPGDIVLKNHGYREKVVAVYPSASGKTVMVTFEWRDSWNGQLKWTSQRVRAGRILAIAHA